MDDEKQFLRKLSQNNPDLDKPEIAVEFARLLMAHKRFNDALLIIRTALEEGPRYDLYELRAASAHSSLEELWHTSHESMGVKEGESPASIYNKGLHEADPDWRAVLAKLTGS